MSWPTIYGIDAVEFLKSAMEPFVEYGNWRYTDADGNVLQTPMWMGPPDAPLQAGLAMALARETRSLDLGKVEVPLSLLVSLYTEIVALRLRRDGLLKSNNDLVDQRRAAEAKLRELAKQREGEER